MLSGPGLPNSDLKETENSSLLWSEFDKPAHKNLHKFTSGFDKSECNILPIFKSG